MNVISEQFLQQIEARIRRERRMMAVGMIAALSLLACEIVVVLLWYG